MPLNIRDENAVILARNLAKVDGTTMTDAVIRALKETLAARKKAIPLRERHLALAERLAALAQVGGRDMSKEETEELWRS